MSASRIATQIFGGAGFIEGSEVARLYRDASRSIIATNDSPDVGFDASLNPYRGCEHGCIYCFARPCHAWLGYSPGLDFETKLLAKPEAASLLRKELSRKQLEMTEASLKDNAKVVITEHGVSPSLILGDLPVSVSSGRREPR